LQAVTLSAISPAEACGLTLVFELGYGSDTAWFDDLTLSGKTPLCRISSTPSTIPRDGSVAFPNDDTNPDSINLTRFLEAPEGKHIFVPTRNDGHL
jgi:hypothetical protein